MIYLITRFNKFLKFSSVVVGQKKIVFVFLFFIESIFCAVPASGATRTGEVTLQEAFQLARGRSTTVALTSNQIDQTDAQINQARAGYLPVLSLQASTFQQAQSSDLLVKSNSGEPQTTTNINLSQNIFQGFRDINSVHQRDQLKLGYEWVKKQALDQLYKDVAQAFYSILIFQSDILVYKEQTESTRQRRSELGSAKKSGRARDSDLLTVDSAVASLEVAISRAQAQLIVFQESFTVLTGLSDDVKLVNTISLPKEIESVGTWLEHAEQRPDIQQSKIFLLAADDGIKVARSGFYPSLGLSANYYFSRPEGIASDVDWDAGLVLSFPFFSGGLTKAQVSEATLIRQAKELNLRRTRELATQIIRTTFATVQSDLDQLSKLTRASDLSRRSHDLVRRDNRLGVATNADVLSSLQIWQETKRNLERIRITATYDYVRLLVESAKSSPSEASNE